MATASVVPPSPDLALVQRHVDAIRAAVARAQASNPRLIGAIVRGETPIDGRIDVLVDHAPRLSLLRMVELETELAALLGVGVDVTTDGGLTPVERQRYAAEAIAL